MIKRILLSVSESPLDKSETSMAFELARRHEARITGFAAVDAEVIAHLSPKGVGVYSSTLKEGEALLQAAQTRAIAAIDSLRNACARESVEFEGAAISGVHDVELNAKWRFQDICLMSTHPWEPGAEDVANPNAVLHHVAMGLRPLIAVPEWIPVSGPSKVLVALSGSLESAKAMKQFVQLGLYPGIDMTLVTVGNPKSGERAEELLTEAAHFAEAHGYPATKLALPETDNRVHALLDAIDREGAELLVAGSSYRKFLFMERFGKHAAGLLQKSPIPLFLSH